MKRLTSLLLAAICCLYLSGCIPILVGGAAGAAAAYFIVHDNRNWPSKKADEEMRKNIAANLALVPAIKNNCHITVAVYNGKVLLVGQAPNQGLKDKAQEIASATPSIKKLYNQITVEAPTSQVTRMNDLWLSTKIQTAIMSDKLLKDASMLIIVEDGNVYIMGDLTYAQSDAVVNKTRSASGVQQVIKVITYKKLDS